MVGPLVALLVAGSALWVYLDASKHRIGKVHGTGSMWNFTAGGWGAATLLLWAIAFPVYLAKRSGLVALAAQQPRESEGRPMKALALGLAGLALVGVQVAASPFAASLSRSNLPSCTSLEIQTQAGPVLAERIPGVSLRSFEESAVESASNQRRCRARASVDGSHEVWAHFVIEERDGNRLFIEFDGRGLGALMGGPSYVASSAPETATGPVITAAEFAQISTGMSVAEVEDIIGQTGEIISESEFAGHRTVMYQWTNADASNANAMFQNGRLQAKAQFGLR